MLYAKTVFLVKSLFRLPSLGIFHARTVPLTQLIYQRPGSQFSRRPILQKTTAKILRKICKAIVQQSSRLKKDQSKQIKHLSFEKKKQVAQLLIKFTTDESCKLKITNLDLDEVIDWDLFQNDNGTLYLKPGKYSIVATSVIDGSKTKSYNFDVKSGYSHTMQNLHISFR